MKKILLALLMTYNAANVHGMHLRNNQIIANSYDIAGLPDVLTDISIENVALPLPLGQPQHNGILACIFRQNAQMQRIAVANADAIIEGHASWLAGRYANNTVCSDLTRDFSRECKTKQTFFQQLKKAIELLNINAQTIGTGHNLANINNISKLRFYNMCLSNSITSLVNSAVSHGLEQAHQHFFYEDDNIGNFQRNVNNQIPTVSAFLMPHYHETPNPCYDAITMMLSMLGDIKSIKTQDAFNIKIDKLQKYEEDFQRYDIAEFRQNVDITLNHDIQCWKRERNSQTGAIDTIETKTNGIRFIIAKEAPANRALRVVKNTISGEFYFRGSKNEDCLLYQETRRDFLANEREVNIDWLKELLKNKPQSISVFPVSK